MLYLLQLVQALKFETPTSPSPSSSSSIRHSRHLTRLTTPTTSTLADSTTLPTLAEFLIERSARNPVLGNHFYWYIQVECEDKMRGKMFEEVARRFEKRVKEVSYASAKADSLALTHSLPHPQLEPTSSSSSSSSTTPSRLDLLHRQSLFIKRISTLAIELRNSKDARPKKVDRLRSVLSSSSSHLSSFPSIPLPLDARINITGIDAEKSSVFKSNLFPLRLHLLTDDSSPSPSSASSYPIIFKNGDDLRQDQLVIQLITLMDRLLRKENLDLKLMPYRVLATGQVDGMVQFVESMTLQDISNEFGGSLLGYLRRGNPDPGSVGTYGVKPEVLDTYVRSCGEFELFPLTSLGSLCCCRQLTGCSFLGDD